MQTSLESVDPTDNVSRELLHTRSVEMRGLRRSDGLYEVEGWLTDRKPYDFQLASVDRIVPAHEPLHDIGVRIVFDAQLKVQDVEDFLTAVPYADCMDSGTSLRRLIGVHMSSGWSREVRSRLGGAQGCTHLVNLLIQMATTAFQAMTIIRKDQPVSVNEEGLPQKIDSCYAYRASGDLVELQWPRWHRKESK